MKRTIFPPKTRQVQQTLATGQRSFEVATDDEMRAKIGIIAANGQPATIVITAPIVTAAPYIIPAACAGLTIRSAGKHTITPSGVVSSLFDIRASEVTLDCIRCISDAYDFVAGAPGANRFELFITRTTADYLTAMNCRTLTDQVIVDDTAGDGSVVTVFINHECSASMSPVLVMFQLVGTGGALVGVRTPALAGSTTMKIYASRMSIIGCNGGDFDSSVSVGGDNRLAGNYFAGTKTLHADDIDADDHTPLAHAASHENGGSDEIDVGGLSGVLADAQTPATHASMHENGGAGEISVAGLSGKLADGQDALALLSATTTVNVSSATAPTSGQVLTATSSTAATWQTPSGGSAWTTITKATTETITSDATLGDDAELKFAMAANTTYRFRLAVMFETTSGNDFQYQLNGPASPTKVTVLCTHGAQGAAPATQVVDTSYGGTASGTMAGGTGVGSIRIEGIIENGANAGDLAFQWAAAVVLAQNSSVLKGSYIEYAEVA